MTRHALSEAAFEEALCHGSDRSGREFRADAVHYWPEQDAVAIMTARHGGFVVPRGSIPPLRDLDPAALARFEVWPGGSAFEVPGHDIHVSVHGLLTAALPDLIPAEVLSALSARRAGASTSAVEGVRGNGRKGPRKRATEPA